MNTSGDTTNAAPSTAPTSVTFNCEVPITPAFHAALQSTVNMGTRGVCIFHHQEAKRLLEQSEYQLIDYGSDLEETHNGEFGERDAHSVEQALRAARLARASLDHLITTLEAAHVAIGGDRAEEKESSAA